MERSRHPGPMEFTARRFLYDRVIASSTYCDTDSGSFCCPVISVFILSACAAAALPTVPSGVERTCARECHRVRETSRR